MHAYAAAALDSTTSGKKDYYISDMEQLQDQEVSFIAGVNFQWRDGIEDDRTYYSAAQKEKPAVEFIDLHSSWESRKMPLLLNV